MTKEKKHELLNKAYTLKEVADERKEIYVINEDLPALFYDAIKAIQFKLNESTGTFELDYPIMNDACNAVNEVEFKDLAEKDFFEDGEYASVYTAERLSYLTMNNQAEISEILREYGTDVDIATASAVWYDRKVMEACQMIKDYVLKNEA